MTILTLKPISEELFVKAYRSGTTILLAMNLDKTATDNLAGFSILCTPPNKPAYYLNNRLNFTSGIHRKTTEADRKWTPSNLAPFQKFRWIHSLPEEQVEGFYKYTVTAMYFNPDSSLKEGASTSVTIDLSRDKYTSFQDCSIGFTRGYLSSQAYAEKFKNAYYRPEFKSIDFDTTAYQDQYKWLGGDARRLVFDFLEECLKDPCITVDLFAYDLDEPDFIRSLQKLGNRLRAVLDNSHLHKKPGSLEIVAKERLIQSAGEQNIVQGHFKRFAHNKVLIQKKDGKAIKVLTGSANFSLRGLYVQANNIIIFDYPEIAGKYEEAFNTTFTDMQGFKYASIASQWFDFNLKDTLPVSIAFSPHVSYNVSLDKVAESISKAENSILFAVMELSGKGPVLSSLQNLVNSQGLYSYGITQHAEGLSLFKPGVKTGEFAPFSYLKETIPENFKEEWSGGMGQVIHNKFVVVDFNGKNPVVYTGSSNLAGGGEEENGDNLIAIYDRQIATAYAVEAIRLVDHYHFRFSAKNHPSTKPLVLQGPEEKWWEPYYDENDPKFHDRETLTKDMGMLDLV